MVILTGSLALDSPRIVQEGSLTGGTIAAQSKPDQFRVVIEAGVPLIRDPAR